MILKHYYRLLCFLVLLSFSINLNAQVKARVLIYTKTGGYAHASIPDGIKAVQKIGLENNFAVDTTSKTADFTDENLKKYAALIFISTNPGSLNEAQRSAFTKYIQAGGGFAGVHGASAGGRGWPWYVQLVGGVFVGHPEPKEGVLLNENSTHQLSQSFPSRLTWKDEWYNFGDLQNGLNVLLSVDESSFLGGGHGKNHPIAWYREFDGGRTFYTALGHFSHHFSDALFVQHLEAGIKYAMGDLKIDSSKTSNPKYNGK